MSSLPGCIVHTPGTNLAYKVLLIYRGHTDTEHAFATMREAEAFLRSNTASGSPTRPSTDTCFREEVGLPLLGGPPRRDRSDDGQAPSGYLDR